MNIDGVKFKNNNGVVLRTIASLFSNGWFSGRELKTALSSYSLELRELHTALDYFTDRKYIASRSIESKKEALISDCNLDELEFKLAADGRLIITSQICDAGIEM